MMAPVSGWEMKEATIRSEIVYAERKYKKSAMDQNKNWEMLEGYNWKDARELQPCNCTDTGIREKYPCRHTEVVMLYNASYHAYSAGKAKGYRDGNCCKYRYGDYTRK